MTSLAQQLKRLAIPTATISGSSDVKKVSLLFDKSKSASLDCDTIYSLGINGLEELTSIDPSFHHLFYEKLFSESAKATERTVQTKDFNEKLNTTIESFLVRLSPYILMRCAQKCIEWLLYRFHIHVFNVDAIFVCIFPYYSTKTFVKVVQLLDIAKTNSKWNWIAFIQKPGIALSVDTVVKACISESQFLHFVCNMVPKCHKLLENSRNLNNQMKPFINFYASIILGSISHLPKLKNKFLSQVVPFLIKGITSELSDYNAASYLIISHICSKTTLNEKVVSSIMQAISKAENGRVGMEFVTVLVVICQTQISLKELPEAIIQNFIQNENFMEFLENLSRKSNLDRFLSLILKGIIPHAFDSAETSVNHGNMLHNLLTSIELTSALKNFLVGLIFDQCVLCQFNLNDLQSKIVNFCQKKYPIVFDDIMSAKFKEVDQDVVKSFSQLALSASKHQIVPGHETSMLLCLSHPEPTVRLSGLTQLESCINDNIDLTRETFVKNTVTLRLNMDENVDVVMATLRILEKYPQCLFDEEEIACSTLAKVIMKQRSFVDWQFISVTGLNLLVSNLLAKEKSSSSSRFLAYGSILECLCMNIHNKSLLNQIKQHLSTLNEDKLLTTCSDDVLLMVKKFILVSADNFGDILKGVRNLCEVVGVKAWKTISYPIILTACLQANTNYSEKEPKQMMRGILHEIVQSLEDIISCYPEIQLHGENIMDDNNNVINFLNNSEENQNKYAASVFMDIFSKFIKSINMDASKVDCFWQYEEQSSQKLSMSTLLAILKLNSIVDANTEHSKDFISALRNLITMFISELSPLDFIFFTIPLWKSHLNELYTKDKYFTAATQVQVLYISNALLKSSLKNATSQKKLQATIDLKNNLLPSIFLACASNAKGTREAAVKFFLSLNRLALKNDSIDQNLAKMIKYLSEHSVEICNDETSFSVVFQKFLCDKAKDMEEKNKIQILKDFVQHILCNEKVPLFARTGILECCLKQVSLEQVFSQVVPLISQVLKANNDEEDRTDPSKFLILLLQKFTPSSLKNEKSRVVFLDAMKSSKIPQNKNLKTPQITVIDLITKDFFASLSENVQQIVLHELFITGASTKDHVVIRSISKVLKAIKLNSNQVVNEFDSVLKHKPDNTPSGVVAVKRARYQKAQKKKQGIKVDDDLSDEWKKVTFILEKLQHKKKMVSSEILLSPLFDLLEMVMESEPKVTKEENDEMDYEIFEYRKQLILTSLLNITLKLKSSEATSSTLLAESFNIELLVHCVRTSHNLHTQQHLLMVLAEAARVCPKKVLHNVMAIFTFVGSHMIRQDNSFSFQVISKTVKCIIPAVIESTDMKNEESSNPLLFIISVFVNSFGHIPSHRRLIVFEELLNSLGSENYLWITIVMLIDQFINKPSLKTSAEYNSTESEDEPKESTRIPSVTEAVENWASICTIFSKQEQITCFIKIVEYINQLPDENTKEFMKKHKSSQIIDLRLRSIKQIRKVKLSCLAFLSYMLRSNKEVQYFAAEMNNQGLDEVDHAAKITVLFRRLLEVLLNFIDGTAKISKELAIDQNTHTFKFNKVLLHKSYDLLDKINLMLPRGSFLLVLQGLLQHKLLSTRKKAMELLTDRIHTEQGMFQKEEIAILVSVAKQLKKAATHTSNEDDSMENESCDLRGTSWQTMKAVVHLCGKQNTEIFVDLLPVIGEMLQTTSYHQSFSLITSVILCLAELAVSLKTYCVAHMPSFMPPLLNLLKKKETLESDNVVLACLTALHRIIENLTSFVSPYLNDVLSRITALRLIEKYEETIEERGAVVSQISIRLQHIFQIVSTKISTRVLLPSMKYCKPKIEERRPKCLEYLIQIAAAHLNSLKKNEINQHINMFGDFFIDALEFRTNVQLSIQEINDVENAIISSSIVMMLKLSEKSFRPMFFKFYNWACLSSNKSVTRNISFHRLSLALAEKLKGLFAMFSGHLLNNIVEVLKRDVFKDQDVDKSMEFMLLTAAVDLFSTILKYDTSNFLTKERFQLVLHPLVNHLEDMQNNEESFVDTFVMEHLIPCLGATAVAVNDDTCWKPFNYEILLKTKHSNSSVQLAALKSVEKVAEKLEENYMLVLPESIPFFAELMEDGDESVESACQEVIRKLEKILGEDLQKYF